jgi:hypothetical protein
MPELLAALDAFVEEHHRCGELDGGVDGLTTSSNGSSRPAGASSGTRGTSFSSWPRAT